MSTHSEYVVDILDCRPDGHTLPPPRHPARESKKISNDQELIQSDPTSCPQNQKGNN